MIREAIETGIRRDTEEADQAWKSRGAPGPPKLHPSYVGYCRRKAILAAHSSSPSSSLYQEPTHPLDLYTQEVMRDGRLWERENGDYITAAYPGTIRNPQYETDLWLWELDFVLPDGTIVEHKSTADYNFRVRKRLPYASHCIQLMVYQCLMLDIDTLDAAAVVEKGGPEITPRPRPCVLYYHGRGNWAEFRVWQTVTSTKDVISWDGLVNGTPRSGHLDMSVIVEIAVLEDYLRKGALPPRLDTPFESGFNCTRGSDKKGYWPACKWFGFCWPDLPQNGPLYKDKS